MYLYRFLDNQLFEQGTFINNSRAAALIGIAQLKKKPLVALV